MNYQKTDNFTELNDLNLCRGKIVNDKKIHLKVTLTKKQNLVGFSTIRLKRQAACTSESTKDRKIRKEYIEMKRPKHYSWQL